MKNVPIAITFLILLSFLKVSGQTDTLRFNLDEIVALAQSDAPDVLLAEARMKNRYWAYQAVLAGFKPAISFSGELPDLNRSIDEIVLPSGSSSFIQRAQMRNRLGLSLTQSVVPTGGTVFLSSGLQRLDIFQTDQPSVVSYYSTPISIGFIQPIFGFNQMKWNKRIEPLRYQEATREYAEQMEDVAYQASGNYFDVLAAQLDLQAAKLDKSIADTLLEISRERFKAGRLSEAELLQIELRAMNSDAALQQALLDQQAGMEKLRSFLGIGRSVFFNLETPTNLPEYELNAEHVLKLAKENRREMISYERRLAQADESVARAKANSGLQIDISGIISLSQTGKELKDAYFNPLDNERVRLGLNIPIADWGKAKARLQTAQTNLELEQMNVARELINFEQEILLKVKQFDLLRQQVNLSLRAYELSVKREDLTRNRYYIGKIGMLDLNVAVTEKETARRNYMNSLRTFWLAHYDLRRYSLYDFERDVSLSKKVDGY